MTLYKTGWLLVALQVILLLIWVYDVVNPRSNTDAAGKGLAQLYILALTVYIIIGIILQLIHNRYCTIAVIIMAMLPLLLVVIGLLRKYS